VAKDAGRHFVRFTRAAGERIGRAVIAVEHQTKGTRGLSYEHQTPLVTPNTKTFRVATFSGAWGKDSFKTVTLQGSTATLSVENFLYTLPDSGTKKISVAKDGTGWFLLGVEHVTQDIIWNVEQTSTALRFDRMQVWVPAKVSTTPVIIALAECVTGYTGS
jgi:hypothetical protein